MTIPLVLTGEDALDSEWGFACIKWLVVCLSVQKNMSLLIKGLIRDLFLQKKDKWTVLAEGGQTLILSFKLITSDRGLWGFFFL